MTSVTSVTNASGRSGGPRLDEALSARSAFVDTSADAPSDAFERGLFRRRLHRDSDRPSSQSRPWLLWFLIIALSGGIAATVFWSDTSISRDGSRGAVGSDSAWRGVIRQPRPDRSAPVTKLAIAKTDAKNFESTTSNQQISPAATTSAKPLTRSEPSAQPSTGPQGDPTVLSIQELLRKKGFNPGPADGLMGKRTQTAILAWQLQVGLLTTGTPSKRLLEQLLDPAKVTRTLDRLPIGDLVQAERDTLLAWCTKNRVAANSIAYFECMGEEVAKLRSGLRLPELANEVSGNFDAFATARLLCTDQIAAAPQTYFKCLHTKLGRDKPLLVME